MWTPAAWTNRPVQGDHGHGERDLWQPQGTCGDDWSEIGLPAPLRLDNVDPAGERLPSVRKGGVAGRPGQDEPARPQITVHLGLDRVQKFRYVLAFVDEHRAGTGDEPAWVVPDGGTRRRVVAVDDRLAQVPRRASAGECSCLPSWAHAARSPAPQEAACRHRGQPSGWHNFRNRRRFVLGVPRSGQ